MTDPSPEPGRDTPGGTPSTEAGTDPLENWREVEPGRWLRETGEATTGLELHRIEGGVSSFTATVRDETNGEVKTRSYIRKRDVEAAQRIAVTTARTFLANNRRREARRTERRTKDLAVDYSEILGEVRETRNRLGGTEFLVPFRGRVPAEIRRALLDLARNMTDRAFFDPSSLDQGQRGIGFTSREAAQRFRDRVLDTRRTDDDTRFSVEGDPADANTGTRPLTAEEEAQWTATLSKLEAAGVDVGLIERDFNAADLFRRNQNASFSRRQRLVQVVMDNVADPNTRNLRALLHEAGHFVVGAADSPALVRAANRLSLDLVNGEANITREQLARPEEALVELLAVRMQNEGVGARSRNFARRLVDAVKDLMVRGALAVQKSVLGPEHVSDRLALEFFENRMRAFLDPANNNHDTFLSMLGGPRVNKRNVARSLPRTPESVDEAVMGRDRVLLPDVIPDSDDSVRFAMRQYRENGRGFGGDALERAKRRNRDNGGRASEALELLESAGSGTNPLIASGARRSRVADRSERTRQEELLSEWASANGLLLDNGRFARLERTESDRNADVFADR